MTDTIISNNVRKLKVIDVAINGDYEDLASERGQIGDLPSLTNCDLNTVLTSGRYWIDSAGQTNGPAEGFAGVLEVSRVKDSTNIYQLIRIIDSTNNNTKTYARFSMDSGVTWTEWEVNITNNSAFITEDVVVGGSLSAESVIITADGRLKENLKVLSDIDISSLKAYTYNFKNSNVDKIGLVAQDVQKICPQAVSEQNNISKIDYNAIVALLVNKVNNLEHRIRELENHE